MSPRRLAGWLARNGRVPPACMAAHHALVRERVVWLARVVAVFALAWSVLDFLRLGPANALPALLVRAAAALGLLTLAARTPRLSVRAIVHTLVWAQAIPFTVLQWLVASQHDSALEIGYGLFPYVLAAQLALLPLPWWRTLVAALAPAAQLVAFWWVQPAPPAQAINGAWLFMLIVAVAAWTGQAQLRLLVDLLGARHDAFHDALTGLANRRAAAEQLEGAMARARREGEPLSVLMLDIDHFKRVNDAHGHADGDRVLVALADSLRRDLRAGDLAARHGGEEFLVVLPSADAGDALDAAERIRVHVQALRIPLSATAVSITVSIGVATLRPGESTSALLDRADAALYRAKEEGRNRCVAALVGGHAGASPARERDGA